MFSPSSLSISHCKLTTDCCSAAKTNINKAKLLRESNIQRQKLNKNVPSMHASPFLRAAIVPLATSLSIILWSSPVHAGVLSGFSGLESVPGPQLPEIDFLKKWNEDNQKKYAELDSRFKSSPVLKDLLEKSRLNKEKNKKATQDKYCLRGAEWGVGDCSTVGMTEEEKDAFVSMLKKKIEGD